MDIVLKLVRLRIHNSNVVLNSFFSEQAKKELEKEWETMSNSQAYGLDCCLKINTYRNFSILTSSPYWRIWKLIFVHLVHHLFALHLSRKLSSNIHLCFATASCSAQSTPSPCLSIINLKENEGIILCAFLLFSDKIIPIYTRDCVAEVEYCERAVALLRLSPHGLVYLMSLSAWQRQMCYHFTLRCLSSP